MTRLFPFYCVVLSILNDTDKIRVICLFVKFPFNYICRLESFFNIYIVQRMVLKPNCNVIN